LKQFCLKIKRRLCGWRTGLLSGKEIWNFSLVDPDNRRPVDYKIRMEMLEELKEYESDIGPLKLIKDATALKLSEVFSNSPVVLLDRVYT
jgi:maltooligosyltrehalose synthase